MGQMLDQKIEHQEGWVSFLSKNGSILMSAEAFVRKQVSARRVMVIIAVKYTASGPHRRWPEP